MTGPWSEKYIVWGNGDNPDGYSMYAPAPQPLYSDPDGRYVVVMYSAYGSGAANILQAVNIVGPADESPIFICHNTYQMTQTFV